ncbi:MAG: hypothetical protein ACP5KA_05255 [Desulfurococcaceae archaeon]
MGVLGFFISTIYKSLFLAGESGYKLAHPASKLAFIASAAAFLALRSPASFLATPLVLVLGAIHPGLSWVASALALSALAGSYFALSAYLLSLTGLYYMSLLDVLLVALRTSSISLLILFAFTTISPLDLFNALLAAGARRFSSYPLLVWRLAPQGLKNFAESLAVGSLKREPATKRIPAAAASIIEAGWLTEEYCYWRLRAEPTKRIKLGTSPRHTLLLVAASAILLIACLA